MFCIDYNVDSFPYFCVFSLILFPSSLFLLFISYFIVIEVLFSSISTLQFTICLSKIFRPTLEPNQRTVLCIPGGSFPGTKRLMHEVNNTSPSSAEVKNEWSFTSTLSPYLHVVCRDMFTFTLFSRLTPYPVHETTLKMKTE